MNPLKLIKYFFRPRARKNQIYSTPFHLPSMAIYSQDEVQQNKVFHNKSAIEINIQRVRHIEKLKIDWSGQSVLDMGCGTGYFAKHFEKNNAKVTFADARSQNLEEAKLRAPIGKAIQFNIEKDPIEKLGFFDIVFSYGLLYHLENPMSAIRKLSLVCKSILLIETIICDHTLPVNQLVLESPHVNQALHGIGSRPSPAYIILSLRNAGWRWIYTAKNPPDHPDFHFEWKNNLEYSRHGKNLRCFFLASRSPLNNPELELLMGT